MKFILFVATVLTVYGIETSTYVKGLLGGMDVATVLTVYGIETIAKGLIPSPLKTLQQYLPFTVLKHSLTRNSFCSFSQVLQQYLPFTVLKLYHAFGR